MYRAFAAIKSAFKGKLQPSNVKSIPVPPLNATLTLKQREELQNVAAQLRAPSIKNATIPKPSPAAILNVDNLPEEMTPLQICEYGNNLYNGDNGLVKNEDAAINFWKKSWEYGDNDAGYNYARVLLEGSANVEKDELQAFEIFKIVEKSGNPYAQFALAGMYKYSPVIEQDLEEAFQLYHISAQNGILPAIRAVGDAYLNGHGVDKDFFLASEFYKKASEAGDPIATFNLSNMYYDGRGVEKDFNQAVFYAKQAANNGIIPARHFLGFLFITGDAETNVSIDYKEAFKHFKVAADLGFAPSAINLGHLYLNGHGVPKSTSIARVYYQLAAENPDFKSAADEFINKLDEKAA